MFLLGLRNQNQKRVPKTRQEGLSILLSLLTLLAPKGALYAMPGAPLPVRRKKLQLFEIFTQPTPEGYNGRSKSLQQLSATQSN